MFRSAAAAVAAAFALVSSPLAAQEVDPRLAQAMDICLDEFPDLTGYTHDAAVAGFHYEMRVRGAEFYTAYRQALIVAFMPGEPGCLFGLNGQHDATTIAATRAVIESTYGTNATRIGPSPDGEFIDGWLVALPTGPVFVGVTQSTWILGRFHGSFIMVSVPDQQH